MTKQIGIIGAGVMGANLARNLARHDFEVAIYDRDAHKVKALHGDRVFPTYTIENFLGTLESPRRIWLMVNAGKPVESVLDDLKPYLAAGDVVMDGGNSYFKDTERRMRDLAARETHLISLGVSGGAEGALHGPSLMPSGAREAYDVVSPFLRAIAATTADGEPCVTYLGEGGAGHYVKMVHNGIEYALMQAIAEIYDLLTRCGGLQAEQVATLFAEWNTGVTASFLLEISTKILNTHDGEAALVDLILDTAEQKGTGRWASQNALEVGRVVSMMTSAVEARIMSAHKAARVQAAKILPGPQPTRRKVNELINAARAALCGAMVIAFSQGFDLLHGASDEYHYSYALADVAHIWRAGCIIRANILDEIRVAYRVGLDHLLLSESLRETVAQCQTGWRDAVTRGVLGGVPLPTLSAALAYYDSYRSERLPSNLIQAQRNFFGAHSYQRLDRAGNFHTHWGAELTKKR